MDNGEGILNETMLLEMSEKINPTVTPVHAFSVHLGVTNAQGNKELIKGLHLQDLSIPYYNILQHYIGTHGTGKDSALQLRVILRQNSMVPVAELLEKELKKRRIEFDDQPSRAPVFGGREVTGAQGPSSTSAVNEMGGISDKELHRIARAIGGNNPTKLMALGSELDFTSVKAKQFTASNTLGGEVTDVGTSSMLFDWRDSTLKKDQRCILRKALMGVGYVKVVEDHLAN